MRKVGKSLLFTGAVALVVGACLISAPLYTYRALTEETLIAELRFTQTGPQQYLAYLRTGDGCIERVLPVLGDQWRIDAEFLKWKSWANLLGLDAQYRLDRLEGRYRSAAEQNARPRLAHEIGDPEVIDLVAMAESLGRWNFLLDATYGSSTYQDVDTGRVFRVYRTQAAIITRSEIRAPSEPDGEALAITIGRACGEPPGLWQRMATWVNRTAAAFWGRA